MARLQKDSAYSFIMHLARDAVNRIGLCRNRPNSMVREDDVSAADRAAMAKVAV